MSLLNIGKLSLLFVAACAIAVAAWMGNNVIVNVSASMPSAELASMVRVTLSVVFGSLLLLPVAGVAVCVIDVMGDHADEKRFEAGLKEKSEQGAATELRTFIINRHAIPCISDVWVDTEGNTWLALCDELILSVVYEDSDICHCIELPHFSDVTSQYIEDGILEVANA